MTASLPRPLYAAAIIERADNHILIALPAAAGADRQWIFPRCLSQPAESAEAAMRRFARDQLGLVVELVIGQPPFVADIDSVPSEIRYFFCGVAGGDLRPGPYSETRWIQRAQFREFNFDDASKPVVEWLLSH